jgi:hypothetical protein
LENNNNSNNNSSNNSNNNNNNSHVPDVSGLTCSSESEIPVTDPNPKFPSPEDLYVFRFQDSPHQPRKSFNMYAKGKRWFGFRLPKYHFTLSINGYLIDILEITVSLCIVTF